jgi:hypothetical protein
MGQREEGMELRAPVKPPVYDREPFGLFFQGRHGAGSMELGAGGIQLVLCFVYCVLYIGYFSSLFVICDL